jgi:hypothetical protein
MQISDTYPTAPPPAASVCLICLPQGYLEHLAKAEPTAQFASRAEDQLLLSLLYHVAVLVIGSDFTAEAPGTGC